MFMQAPLGLWLKTKFTTKKKRANKQIYDKNTYFGITVNLI